MKPSFWPGKRVLVTGHTGFKGAWLSLWLQRLGAEVTGLALEPATDPSLFECLRPSSAVESIIGDITDPAVVARSIRASAPEIIFHLAAQSLVRQSYADPADTFATNTMGTVHLLDAVRCTPTVRTVLVVTSDKVYEQSGGSRAFLEEDRLGGTDPYSASKAIQELVAASYAASFFDGDNVRLATSRAGNVIGGGDWATDRLIPDFFRANTTGNGLTVRQPDATRPWQHVFEPLRGYLTYAEHLDNRDDVPASLNFGPTCGALSVAEVLEKLAALAPSDGHWEVALGDGLREHTELAIDSSAADKWLGWKPHLGIDEALELTAAWYRAHAGGRDMHEFSLAQLDTYLDGLP